jgi:hypothetical protein
LMVRMRLEGEEDEGEKNEGLINRQWEWWYIDHLGKFQVMNKLLLLCAFSFYLFFN